MLRTQFKESVDTFQYDREVVHDHSLKNVMTGKRSFSINDEYRVIYIEKKHYIVLIDVGTHEQVYRQSD